jgi:hypothetical protein
VIKDRKGIIKIAGHIVKRKPEEVMKIFSMLGFLPFHAEFDPVTQRFVYVGMSRNFETVFPAASIPEYLVHVNVDHRGVVDKAEVEKVKTKN